MEQLNAFLAQREHAITGKKYFHRQTLDFNLKAHADIPSCSYVLHHDSELDTKLDYTTMKLSTFPSSRLKSSKLVSAEFQVKNSFLHMKPKTVLNI